MTLEIIRGRARQRIRPIVRPAFLIGSAADSDLMLGAEKFPAAHCYLLLNPEGVGLRWLGFAPEVLVNDRPVEKAELEDGDLLRTGPYEFRIRIRSGDTVLKLTHPRDGESDADRFESDAPRGKSFGPQDSAEREISGLLSDIRLAFGLEMQTATIKSVASRGDALASAAAAKRRRTAG